MMQKQQGFTTVELLVTLIIATLFIISGYQLYTVITMRSGNARMIAEASNIGYEVLRKEGSVHVPVTTSCSASVGSHPKQTVTRASSTLPSLTINIIRCLPVSTVSLVRVTVVVAYGSPAREVVHATYMPL